MTATDIESSRKIARLAGILYVIYIVIMIVSFSLQHNHVVWGDAATTARNILASPQLFRIDFMAGVMAPLVFFLTAWALYVVLKSVNKSIALLFLLCNLVGVAVECVGAVIHYGAFLFLDGSDYLKVFSADQLQALTMWLLKASGTAGIVETLFYGVWLFPLGYLVFKSGFLPWIFGILLIADGTCLVICFVQRCLFPGYESLTHPLYPVMFVAEFGFSLWLLVRGVATDRAPSLA